MKKIKLAIFAIAILLMCSGVAYASWTEQVQLDVSAKTASTELHVLKVRAKGARVDATAQNQVAIFVKKIQPGETAIIDITFKNTGTIPVDIDDVIISSVGGYSADNKKDLTLSISASANGKSIFYGSKQISQWKTNGAAGIKGLLEVPVGGTVIIRVQVTFAETNKKDKAEKETGKKDKAEKEESEIFENVTFILRPEYSRFNED